MCRFLVSGYFVVRSLFSSASFSTLLRVSYLLSFTAICKMQLMEGDELELVLLHCN